MVCEATHLRHHLANPFLVIVVLAIVVDDVADLFFSGTTLAASCCWRLQSTLKQNRIFTLNERLSKLNQASRELKKLF